MLDLRASLTVSQGMHCVVASAVMRLFCVPAVSLICLLRFPAAAAETVTTSPPEVLTNLFELRRHAGREPSVVHPFRIVADVIDVDASKGVLVVRDSSGVEFIRAGFTNRDVVPGARVRLEGSGCGVNRHGFGLAVVPGLVVDNDGIHPAVVESGEVFLHAGVNPIRLEWFNRHGDSSLHVEYEGPNLPRQPIPDSALTRAQVDRATGRTNFPTGLNYRCYHGDWEFLPDFRKHRPTKTGVASNFDPRVRTQIETVGLEFNGFIKVPRNGMYTFHVSADDGSRLFIGPAELDISVLTVGPAPVAKVIVPARVLEENNRAWVTIEGTAASVGVWSTGGEVSIRAGDDNIRVEIFDGGNSAPAIAHHGRVRVTGMYEEVLTEEGSIVPGRLMAMNWRAVQPVESSERSAVTNSERTTSVSAGAGVSGTNGFPVLSTAAEVKALSPPLAEQRFPVSIRGVVTAFSSKHTGAVIQDSTRGVFVDLGYLQGGEAIARGEFYQVDGITGPGFFAPSVIAQRITRLGAGQLPKPVRATWGQLMNGSLDTEYAEIDGLVTAIRGRQMVLLMQGGKITVELKDFRPEALLGYENALIRIRGCCLPNFNMVTRKLEAGSLAVSGAALDVLQRAPRDPFDAPRRSIGELLFYDPQAVPFRRLKVSGQVIYSGAGECFLTDGTNGVHVIAKKPDHFGVGDLMDAVGFLELGGHTVELKEAVMRKTGRAALLMPTKLAPDQLLLARYAGTLVQVNATLINHWREASEHVMELQSGFLAFKARIREPRQAVSLPPYGSRLELTGAYAPLGNSAADGTVGAFELLMQTPAGVRVVATPPWWTLKRVLILAGILAALLCGALVWNKELQWKVEVRGRQLETEIRNRQQAELHRAAEAERSRIARDLHDELGTSLTEVSLMASAGLGQFQDEAKIRKRFHAIAEKSRDLVSGLDAIIWAIDPKRNSLQSFADYVASYANELFSSSGITCRLRVQIECGAVALSESERHSLFLAVKEALNNVIRHASATEVDLRLSQLDDHLQILIADNGRGFDWEKIRRGNGLANLQERLQAVGGKRYVESQPGKGTTIKLVVPLGRTANSLPCKEASQARNSTP